MYLLQASMMRSILAWVVYGFIPRSAGLVWRPDAGGNAGAPAKSFMWAIITWLVFGLWLILLMYLSTLWRDRLDGSFIAFAQFAEEVMLGKKTLFDPSSGRGYGIERWFTKVLEKYDEHRNMSTNGEKGTA